MWSGWGCNMHGMTLAFPAGMSEAHEVSFDLCNRVVQSPLQLLDIPFSLGREGHLSVEWFSSQTEHISIEFNVHSF